MAFGPSGCLRCWCNGRHLPGAGPLSLHPVCAMQDRKQGAGALTAGSGERQDEQMEPAVSTSVHSGSVRKSSLTWRLSIRRRSRSPSFLLWRTTVPVGASSTRRVRCGLSHSVAEMRHRPRDRSEVATRRALQRSHGVSRCRCNGCSRPSFARSFTLALQRCDHETRNHCGGGRHIGDRCGKRQPLHDVGSCPRATIAARETGGGDRGTGLSGSTCAGGAWPACATGVG
jgi:hypothetical protein